MESPKQGLKPPKLNAESSTLWYMTVSASSTILGRPEFQRMPETAFHPFALDEEEHADESKLLKMDAQFFTRLYSRWATFEDALSTICCTDAGADGVTAVTIQWCGKLFED